MMMHGPANVKLVIVFTMNYILSHFKPLHAHKTKNDTIKWRECNRHV